MEEHPGIVRQRGYSERRAEELEAFMSIENLFDTEYREAQFFFTSRLLGEPAGGVPDIHFTPGTPRSVLGGLALRF